MTQFARPTTHPSLTREAAEQLVAAQHPDLAELGLGERYDGWDMSTFRVGDELAVRLPRHVGAVESLEAEARWLGELSAAWTFPIPSVLRRGKPGAGYPWPWSIVTWLSGDIAANHPLDASEGPVVARALAEIHQPAPEDAPFNQNQSVAMAAREDELLPAIEVLATAGTDHERPTARGPGGITCDIEKLRDMWREACDAPALEHDAQPERVWCHADLHGNNVLSDSGRFAGIIDWADMASCDPAVDLGFLYSLMPREGVESAWATYGELTGRNGEALHTRARGVAIDICAVHTQWPHPDGSAMGWRGLAALGLVR